MTVIVVFVLVIAGISGWWLSQQRLMSKPWLEQGAVAYPGTESGSMPAAKVGLGVFLAVVGCLFALFASAYFMRMGISDWRPMPVPKLLWFNTGVLVLSSVALQCAVVAARRQQSDTLRLGLVTAGITAVGFLVGQLMAWRELTEDGYLLTGNPANSFFYLLTGMHGLHILGGLIALAVTTFTAWTVEWRTVRLRMKVELCAMYWHFLLFIWLALFVLLNGWAGQFVDICRQLLT